MAPGSRPLFITLCACLRCRGARWLMSMCLLLVSSAATATTTAASQGPALLPQRNLVIEWRQIDEALVIAASQAQQATAWSAQPNQASFTGGYSVSTQQPATQHPSSQQLRVLNGSRAQIRVNQNVPVMWVEAVQSGLAAWPAASGGRNIQPRYAQAGAGAGVGQSLTWLQAGRQISLLPRWPGRDQPAVVEVQVDTSSLATDRSPVLGAAPLPVQASTQTVTTVVAPLGQWVTIARSGGEPAVEQRGVVSTQTLTAEPRQVMQIRVMVP